MSRRTIYGLSIVGLVLLSTMARADPIVDATVSGTTGAYSYAYEIDNPTSVGLLLFSLTITGDVGTIQSPDGWVPTTEPEDGGTLVEWISTDDSFDVPAFGSLGGFAITSDSAPGGVAFSTFDENFTEFDGQTTGPIASTVPEPGSLSLLSAALIGLYVLRRNRISCAPF
jgi:hypothetical protein